MPLALLFLGTYLPVLRGLARCTHVSWSEEEDLKSITYDSGLTLVYCTGMFRRVGGGDGA